MGSECLWGRGLPWGSEEDVLKLGYGDGCITVTILKTVELYILSG